MIERIEDNEKRLNSLLVSIKKVNEIMIELEKKQEDLFLLKKYYGSRKWFHDRDIYLKEKLKIKAGVLSEDGVWNMLTDIDSLMIDMKRIIKKHDSIK